MTRSDTHSTLARLRALLLGLVVFGSSGLLVELLVLEHWEAWNQRVPLILLAATSLGGLVVLLRAGPTSLRAFRTVLIAAVLSGIVGAWFHYQANAALELEIDSGIALGELFRAAIGGGVPTLAPGAMIQLGLLGLIATYRHPAAASAADRS